jgi:NADPH-dependent 2,4-dienoyl-CoA reductase/sulfur reductase-like enzyme/nitrite reductase/ring-hydroxylating ferredoxin subunit
VSDAPAGPDLRVEGVRLSDVPDGGLVAGTVDGESALLVRRGERVHAIGARCTHYGGPLAEGRFDGVCVRCPWHQAAFRAETGEAVQAPAFDPVPAYEVELRGDRLFVKGAPKVLPAPEPIAGAPASVVVVGGGAAGFAAAETLRREGYSGPITLVGADEAPPCDRPNLSKDYLAGTAPEEWIPLKPDDWYAASRIDLRLGRRARRLIPAERVVLLDDGTRLEYGALVLATGATPVRLEVLGADQPHVHVLRTLRDSRAIVEVATRSRRAVVVGSGFIGLEAAAALATRGLEVHVVGRDRVPMERILGPELGAVVQRLHESHGVRFHPGAQVARVGRGDVELADGSRLDADLVVVGIGVRPDLELAEQAGLAVDRGVVVDARLRTSVEGIWAAGDVARWPDPWSGERIRVEHWAVALRQGRAAARNLLGRDEAFTAVPFFWSQHYDVRINYVGYAGAWDGVEVSGSLADLDAAVAYRKAGRVSAVATVGRDAAALDVLAAMESEDRAAVEAAWR